MRARWFFPIAYAVMGCTAVIGVKDIYFDENATGGRDGGPESSSTNEGGVDPPDPDGGTCEGVDLQTNPQHCGRCGHDCFGGACVAGKCEAVQIATISDAPLEYVVTTPTHLFVSSTPTLSTQLSGIWRLPKTGGMPEHFVTLDYAEAMVVHGGLLYFTVWNSAGSGGGLYSCAVDAPAPCTPAKIVDAELPHSITLDQGKIYFGDQANGNPLLVYTPGGGAPTPFRPDYGHASNILVDAPAAFYTSNFVGPPNRLFLWEIFPDGGSEERTRYESPEINEGHAVITPNAVYLTGYEFFPPAGGVVRRVPRNGSVTPCDFGGTTNKNPYGLAVDATRIYWTNQGDTGVGAGGRPPFTMNASLATCPLSSCCTTPEILWTGNGNPRGIAAEDRVLYFVTWGSGAIWKIAKP